MKWRKSYTKSNDSCVIFILLISQLNQQAHSAKVYTCETVTRTGPSGNQANVHKRGREREREREKERESEREMLKKYKM